MLFVGAFALGVAIARAPGYAGAAGLPLRVRSHGHRRGRAWCCVARVVMLFLAHRPMWPVTLDRESARAAGVHGLCLYVAVALAVVISVQTIGNVLVLALLVTPAAPPRGSMRPPGDHDDPLLLLLGPPRPE